MIDDTHEEFRRILGATSAEIERNARLMAPAYKAMGVRIPITQTMMIDYGLMKDPVHSAWMWPKLVPFPRIDQATRRATHLRDETRRRLSLARIALANPDDLDREGEDW